MPFIEKKFFILRKNKNLICRIVSELKSFLTWLKIVELKFSWNSIRSENKYWILFFGILQFRRRFENWTEFCRDRTFCQFSLHNQSLFEFPASFPSQFGKKSCSTNCQLIEAVFDCFDNFLGNLSYFDLICQQKVETEKFIQNSASASLPCTCLELSSLEAPNLVGQRAQYQK